MRHLQLKRPISLLYRYWFVFFACFLSNTYAEFSEKVVKSSENATVRIMAYDAQGQYTGHGTGGIISNGGHLVSNYHVVRGAAKLIIIYGRGEKVIKKEASIIVSEPAKDLAILRCETLPETGVFTIVDREVAGGQEVMAIGFPGILDEVFSAKSATLEFKPNPSGRKDEFIIPSAHVDLFTPVSLSGNAGKEMRIDSGYGGEFRAIAHSAQISGGNSGGPLIDKDGRLFGINVATSIKRSDYSFAIHASELIAIARVHSIPIDVTTSKASTGAGVENSPLQITLIIILAVFAIVMFLLVLRKPRMVLVDAVSKLGSRAKRENPPIPAPPPWRQSPPPAPVSGGKHMRFRGRDFHGRSYDLPLSTSTFHAANNKLIIGRNSDLSQLHLPHDSVSRQHAILTLQGGNIYVEDRNSGNGTKVNGLAIIVGSPPRILLPGDKLSLGEVDLIYEITE
jgi:hypothetical protein